MKTEGGFRRSRVVRPGNTRERGGTFPQ